MKRFSRLLFILISLLATEVHASLYFEIGAMAVRADDTLVRVYPVMHKLKLGYAITNHYMIELHYASGGDDTDTDTGASVNIDNISAAFLRLDSDLHAGFRLYLLLGSAQTSLTASGINGFTAADDSYSDFAWGIGIEDRTWGSDLFLTLDYTKYYSEEDTSLGSASLGIKYAF